VVGSGTLTIVAAKLDVFEFSLKLRIETVKLPSAASRVNSWITDVNRPIDAAPRVD
jgi:hypothetical protein